jgi:hypothetical protein
MDAQMITQMITAATALVAVIVSPVISLRVARSQFRANVLSANRQQWINALREEVAMLATTITSVAQTLGTNVSEGSLAETFKELRLLEYKIKLRLNPNEGDHAQLVAMVETAENMFDKAKEVDGRAQLYGLVEDIIGKSQEILKREWERVKKGD